MIPWTLLDTSSIPGTHEEMRLYHRGGEFSIRVGSYELMNSRMHSSEDALASLVLERLMTDSPRILVGGLGMGYTLTELLKRASATTSVVVSELVPAVVAWHRGPLAAISRGAINDPRVSIREEDVALVLRKDANAFDAVLLDVDNGPAGLTSKKNDRLYDSTGLTIVRRALRSAGVLAVWSAGPDDRFTRRLQQAGFETEELRVRGLHGKRGPRHVIWIGRSPA